MQQIQHIIKIINFQIPFIKIIRIHYPDPNSGRFEVSWPSQVGWEGFRGWSNNSPSLCSYEMSQTIPGGLCVLVGATIKTLAP